MFENITTILLDLDGLMVYTAEEYRFYLMGEILSRFDISSDISSINEFWFASGGQNRDDIIRKNFGVEPIIFWRTFEELDTPEKRYPYLGIYDDTFRVKELFYNGYLVGIVTGSSPNVLEMKIDRLTSYLGIKKFDSVISAHPLRGIKQKPDPEGIEICLKELDSSPEEAVYIGDGDEDALASRNARLYSDIIVNRGNGSNRLKPTVEIGNLHELRGVLNY